MSRPNAKFFRLLRPLVRKAVNQAIERADVLLDDDEAVDAWVEKTAERIDDRIDLSGVPVVGAVLEVVDGIVIRNALHSAIAEARERIDERQAS